MVIFLIVVQFAKALDSIPVTVYPSILSGIETVASEPV